MTRQVTEMDFRMPEFRDAKAEDYEFRADGKLARKDRWEQAVHSIRNIVGPSGREFEIPDVIEAVRRQAKAFEGWIGIDAESKDPDDWPRKDLSLEVRLQDGSMLRHARYEPKETRWLWNGSDVPLRVVAWREYLEAKSDAPETD